MKKKGFTLVELLVVIAIIAILATVSVVGYTAFLSKANESNAVTELSQIRDVVNAAVLDGKETVKVDNTTTVDFKYANGILTATATVTTEAESGATEPTVTTGAATAEQIAAAMLALTEMTINEGQTFVVTLTDGKVTSVAYTYAKDITATWTVATGEIK